MTRATLAVICLTYSFVSVTAHDNLALNTIIFRGNYEFIDLTYPFDNNTVYWLGTQNFVFTKKTEDYQNGWWYSANEFTAGEHGGTHLDAPYHFTPTGLHVGELPLEKLIVPLIVYDVSTQTNDNEDFVLQKHHMDLDIFKDVLGGLPYVLVFKFGWSQYFSDHRKYLGLNDAGTSLNFPGLSAEVATWITTQNIVGVGVDVASVDPGKSTDFPVHKILSAKGIYNMENVKLTRPVPRCGCTALVLPMKIAQGSGAPLRLVAICPKE